MASPSTSKDTPAAPATTAMPVVARAATRPAPRPVRHSDGARLVVSAAVISDWGSRVAVIGSLLVGEPALPTLTNETNEVRRDRQLDGGISTAWSPGVETVARSGRLRP